MRIVSFLVATLLLTVAVSPAFATSFLPGGGIDQSTPGLPPSSGGYVSPGGSQTCYSVGGFASALCLVQEANQTFTGATYTTVGSDGLDQFNSVFIGVGTGGPLGSAMVPFMLSGHTSITGFGRPTNDTTGLFDTEMTQLDLTGGGIMLRESPTLASTGQTQITTCCSGQYHIDSFFDVFTELSLDGGVTWTPSTGSTHVDLVAETPEPGSLLLFAGGALVFGLGRRKSAVA